MEDVNLIYFVWRYYVDSTNLTKNQDFYTLEKLNRGIKGVVGK